MGLYIYSESDGSYFAADDGVIIEVPDEIQDADEVEQYLKNTDEVLYRIDALLAEKQEQE